jgi:hypothetical protein
MRLASRDAIRAWLPEGWLGYSVEDVDVSLRIFQSNDAAGTWKLIENKVGTDDIGASKEFHFAAWDKLWRMSDPLGRLYQGYFVINTPTDDWSVCERFRVNGVEIDKQHFRRWLWGDSVDLFLLPFERIRATVRLPSRMSVEKAERHIREAMEIAKEVSFFELVDIRPYRFKQWIQSHIATALRGKLDG